VAELLVPAALLRRRLGRGQGVVVALGQLHRLVVRDLHVVLGLAEVDLRLAERELQAIAFAGDDVARELRNQRVLHRILDRLLLHAALELLLHLQLALRNLLGHVVVGAGLELGDHLLPELLALLDPLHLLLIFSFVELQLLLEALLLVLLLLDASFAGSELRRNLLFLGHAAKLQVPALTEADEMSRDAHVLLHELLGFLHAENVARRNIGRVKDFILTCGKGGDGQDQPLLVGEVAALQIDAALNVEVLEVLLKLLDEDHLRGWGHADAEDDLVLTDTYNLTVLDRSDRLFIYEFR